MIINKVLFKMFIRFIKENNIYLPISDNVFANNNIDLNSRFVLSDLVYYYHININNVTQLNMKWIAILANYKFPVEITNLLIDFITENKSYYDCFIETYYNFKKDYNRFNINLPINTFAALILEYNTNREYNNNIVYTNIKQIKKHVNISYIIDEFIKYYMNNII